MTASIEEGSETWDGARIYGDYWQKGFMNEPARGIKGMYDQRVERLKDLEKTIREDERSESFMVRNGVDGLKEEKQRIQKELRILRGRLEFFSGEQGKLRHARREAGKLEMRGREIHRQVETKIEELKNLFAEFQKVKSEANKLVSAYEFNHWEIGEDERPDTACSWLRLKYLQDFIKKEVEHL